MKLLTIVKDGAQQLGVKLDSGILNVSEALAAYPDSTVPSDVMGSIASGDAAVSALSQYAGRIAAEAGARDYIYSEDSIEFGPCVPNPSKIICVGLNYRKHAEETNSPIPTFPILFNKFNNTITAHQTDVPLPRVSNQVDYEAELCIVIGKEAKNVSRENALGYVFGYCNVNDLSARDLQFRTQQWLLGKSCDKFSPVGPYLVTADEVGNPNDLEIKTIVNGEVRQNSNTADMIFQCDEIISYISQHMSLYPGDIILTGTPEGVVVGLPEDQRVYLKDGDTVTIEIEKLGSLTNRMVNEA